MGCAQSIIPPLPSQCTVQQAIEAAAAALDDLMASMAVMDRIGR